MGTMNYKAPAYGQTSNTVAYTPFAPSSMGKRDFFCN